MQQFHPCAPVRQVLEHTMHQRLLHGAHDAHDTIASTRSPGTIASTRSPEMHHSFYTESRNAPTESRNVLRRRTTHNGSRRPLVFSSASNSNNGSRRPLVLSFAEQQRFPPPVGVLLRRRTTVPAVRWCSPPPKNNGSRRPLVRSSFVSSRVISSRAPLLPDPADCSRGDCGPPLLPDRPGLAPRPDLRREKNEKKLLGFFEVFKTEP